MDQTIDLTKDEAILELIALLKQNQQKETAELIYEMVTYLTGMETKLSEAMQELTDIKNQLKHMEEQRERRTVKNAFKHAIEGLEQQCNSMKQQLYEIKSEVQTKATEIVGEVKKKGKQALNKVSEFLQIRDKLEKFRDNAQETIAHTEDTINKINTFGTGMRQAVHQAANTIRVFMNQPQKEYEKSQFSKTELMKKPFQVKKKLFEGMLVYADNAIDKIEQLAVDVKRHENKTKREKSKISVEVVDMAAIAMEQGFQYGAELFEAFQMKQGRQKEQLVMENIREHEISR